ncbi:MAG: hypothetical protein P4L85_19540 [Paludisphaera borealis]|uniref:hypothetical protein n=1 Tax=Paludisphaera borealis TaxID=1387353 RepID=UPI0028439DF5|nr:hypothetical protein [Paludisphaera borealis]MDR3621554.1 hypothetical protein [Paludisphaera borealis]
MSLISKNGRLYYYRSIRVGGKVVSQYVGSGEFAVLLAEMDRRNRIKAQVDRQVAEGLRLERVEADRKERRKARAVRARLAKDDQRIDGYSRRVDAAVAKALTSLGYHRPDRKDWRKRRGSTMAKGLKYDAHTLVRLAREGDRKALEFVAANNGDLDDATRRVIVHTLPTAVKDAAAPDNEPHTSAVLAHMALMKDRLAPPGSSEIEILLAEHAVICWLHVKRLEQQINLSHIGSSYGRPVANAACRMLSRAQHRYTQSLTALAKVRRLAIPVVIAQMNVGGQHVHASDAGAKAATTGRRQLEKPKTNRSARTAGRE